MRQKIGRYQNRDPADFGYWQLRSLAWRAEEIANGDESTNNTAMLPRLFEGHDWDQEESESWEDDMWSETSSARSTPAADVPGRKT